MIERVQKLVMYHSPQFIERAEDVESEKEKLLLLLSRKQRGTVGSVTNISYHLSAGACQPILERIMIMISRAFPITVVFIA